MFLAPYGRPVVIPNVGSSIIHTIQSLSNHLCCIGSQSILIYKVGRDGLQPLARWSRTRNSQSGSDLGPLAQAVWIPSQAKIVALDIHGTSICYFEVVNEKCIPYKECPVNTVDVSPTDSPNSVSTHISIGEQFAATRQSGSIVSSNKKLSKFLNYFGPAPSASESTAQSAHSATEQQNIFKFSTGLKSKSVQATVDATSTVPLSSVPRKVRFCFRRRLCNQIILTTIMKSPVPLGCIIDWSHPKLRDSMLFALKSQPAILAIDVKYKSKAIQGMCFLDELRIPTADKTKLIAIKHCGWAPLKISSNTPLYAPKSCLSLADLINDSMKRGGSKEERPNHGITDCQISVALNLAWITFSAGLSFIVKLEDTVVDRRSKHRRGSSHDASLIGRAILLPDLANSVNATFLEPRREILIVDDQGRAHILSLDKCLKNGVNKFKSLPIPLSTRAVKVIPGRRPHIFAVM